MSKLNLGIFTVLPLVLGVSVASDALAQRQISGQLEEVIVTAEKREQNLQDVALSVSALDEAALRENVRPRSFRPGGYGAEHDH